MEIEESQTQQVVEPTVQEEPRARQKFVPQNCPMCVELRDDKTKNYSFVYHTAGSMRYCKCEHCGHTWKQKHNPVTS